MASGGRGPAGVPAVCPVEEVPGREHGTVPTHCHSTEEADVKGVMSRVIFVTVTLVQVSVGDSESASLLQSFVRAPNLKVIVFYCLFFDLSFRMPKCCVCFSVF